jgi:hypothetical protein
MLATGFVVGDVGHKLSHGDGLSVGVCVKFARKVSDGEEELGHLIGANALDPPPRSVE